MWSVFSFMTEETAAAAFMIALVLKKKRGRSVNTQEKEKKMGKTVTFTKAYDYEETDYRNYLRMIPTNFEAPW